jgi:hypothetical protein
MSSEIKIDSKKAGAIGIKKEGKGYNLKSSNPRPGYFKSLELAVKEVAATCERRK